MGSYHRFTGAGLPREFYDDWAEVGSDEARHFTTLQKYLEATVSLMETCPHMTGYGRPQSRLRTIS